MKIPLGWAVVVPCLCAYPLWAGPAPVEVKTQSGPTGVNTGLPSVGSTIDNSRISGSNLTLPATVDNKPVPELKPTASVIEVKTIQNDVVPSPVKPAAEQAVTPAKTASTGKQAPKPFQPAARVTGKISRKVEKIKAREPESMANLEGLNLLFDNFRAGVGKSALAAVPGKLMAVEEKIKRNVHMAGSSRPQDAPGFYAKAIQITQESYPKESARRIRETILEEHAIRKAKPSLVKLFNEAYQAAAAGEAKAKDSAVASIGKWAALFQDSKFNPLVVNIEDRKKDLALVLDEGRRSPLSQEDISSLSVSIVPSGASFFVRPPLRKISPLAEGMALEQAVPSSRGMSAGRLGLWGMFSRQRQTGRSVMGSVQAAVSYSWERVWHAIKDVFLRLIGRGRVDEISRGFSVAARPALEQGNPVLSPMNGVRMRRMDPSAPSWWVGKFEAMAEFENDASAFKSLLSRPAPQSDQILARAQAMAAACDRITGEGAALVGVTDVSQRVRADPARAQDLVLGPESLLRYWVSRMEADARGFTMGLPGRAAANVLLSGENGKSLALADLGRPDGPGLRAVERILLDAPASPEGSFVVMNDQILARWTRNGRSVKVYAKVDPGAAMRILVQDAKGISVAADALSAIGFSVEVRGQELAAVWEKTSGVPQALARAVNALQFGSDPALSGDLASAAQGLARLADDLKKRRGQAEDVARVVQARVPVEALRRLVGSIDGSDAFAASLDSADGKKVVVYALKGANDRWSAARAESAGRALSAAEFESRLPKE